MKRISLLPSDIKMQQRFRRKKVLYLAAGVLLLLCFLFLNGFYIFTARKMKSEITFLQQQRGLQQREIDALHEYAAILQQAETAEKLLEQAMGKEPAWDELLVSISLYVPPDLQLTALSAHGNGSNRELTLQGKASGRYTVADLLQGLHKMPQLDDIQCHITFEEEQDSPTPIRFEISAILLPEARTARRREMIAF